MKYLYSKVSLLVIAVILFAIAFLLEKSFFQSQTRFQYIPELVGAGEIDIEEFHKVLHKKEAQLDEFLHHIARDLKEYGFNKLIKQSVLTGLLNKKGFAVLIYENDSLKFWSDNALSVSNTFSNSEFDNKVVHLKNAWVVVSSTHIDNNTIVGLILIKNAYPYENKFLTNDFQSDFNVPSSFKISRLKSDPSWPPLDGRNLTGQVKKRSNGVNTNFAVYNNENKYLFTLVPASTILPDNSRLYFSENLPASRLVGILAGVCFLSLIFFLLFLQKLLQRLNRYIPTNWWLLALGVALIILRYMMLEFRFPSIFYSLDLFAPQNYASSFWLPSLGDFLINSVFIFFFSYNFFKEYTVSPALWNPSEHSEAGYSTGQSFSNRSVQPVPTDSRAFGRIKQGTQLRETSAFIFITFIAIGLYFVLVYYLLNNLIFNSSISFEVYKVLSLTGYSIIGFVIIALLFASFIIVVDTLVLCCAKFISIKQFYLFFFLFVIVVFPLVYALVYPIGIYSILFFIIVILFISFIRFRKHQYQYYAIILLVFLISVYTVYFITATTNEKEKNISKVLVVNLATERDPVAELLLEDVETKVVNDKILIDYLQNSFENQENIYNYLQKKYFHGFLGKYEISQITICSTSDSLLIKPDNELYHCYSFFKDMLNEQGVQLPNTNFYFLDNLNGRISYFGLLKITSDTLLSDITLYIELNSKLISEELGYPELLLDKKSDKTSNISDYSYAKYKNQELITQSGSFSYNLTNEVYQNADEEFSFVKFDGYKHLIYNIDNKNSIVLSKPELKIIDILISFSYIFVFFYLVLSVVLLINNLPEQLKDFQFNFKNKIQFSMISVLLLSLIFIGGGTVYYNIKQYEKKHYENLSEKTQSVLIELEHKLSNEKELTPELQDYLTYLLTKFSNVFYSDINLYDIKGNLLATSRPEIFEKGLLGTKINTEAYRQLVINKKSEFVHNENIGKLNYLSAYVPFKNIENKLLAYLNLPYFTKQNLLKKEISTLVVTVINIYVLLFLLAIVIAVVISGKITKPLRLIQKKFREIELGKKNEPISYESQDEIGSLVKEYNRMVAELSKSAELLAKSERESAWREMAKQIAHEIKNPLTPMKLSVQHLQKAWKDKAPNWDEHLSRVSKTLIKQIDTLSAIATGFSNFAQIPKANNEVVDIIVIIKNSVNLFEDTKNIKVTIDLHQNKRVNVFADKEQLLQVFNNLIKNAIQAIPDNVEGLIKIELFTSENTLKVKVVDNGKGISDELKDKLFTPNFTTKTSGMGLGLTIAKNIVENANGTIWFETEIGKGTTFFVELPVYKKN